MLDEGRRRFIMLLGGTAAAWPLAARAQQVRKPATVGFLGQSTPLGESERAAAFAQRLRELGWVDGRTVAIEYRWADGRSERFAEIAAEFVRLKVDIIVTGGTLPAIAAKQTTSTIPIVFASAGDPVGTGLVASLARPNGNVTGLSVLAVDLAGKRLDLLREAISSFGRLAIMGNVGNPIIPLELGELQAAAHKLGLKVDTLEIRRSQDIAPALEAVKGRADALYVCQDVLTVGNRLRINTLALGLRLPVMHASREHIEAAGLMSYGPNFLDLYRRAGDYVDKILRGAKPGDLPVEQPTKFDLVINLVTARALGLEIPPTLLARADEVIE
jgi:putative ABC transport system substrate-binding protein